VAGLHVPVIPLLEVPGKTGAVEPVHIAPMGLKTGVILAVTVIEMVTGTAHCPVEGLNVYDPEAVLLTVAGLHVPVTPLFEVVGKTGAVAPLQIPGTMVNVGTVVAILKFRQPGGATFPQRSETDPEALVRQTWNAPFVVIAGLSVKVILLPYVAPDAQLADVQPVTVYGPPGPVTAKSAF
jgi:hypothetical protein